MYAWYIFIRAPMCVICKTFLYQSDIVCELCIQTIHPIVTTAVVVSATKTVTVFAISEYKNPLKRLILAKGHSNKEAAMYLGELIWRMSLIKNQTFDYIVPVPLHWSRFAWRGYNQAAEIARVIAKKTGKPVIHALTRKKRTVQQSFFSAHERAENVKDVFIVNKKYSDHIKGKHILLVDDLMTTGSTIKYASKKLFEHKPATIQAVVACRVR